MLAGNLLVESLVWFICCCGWILGSYFSNDSSDMSDRIDYNERFSWCGPTDMTDEYSRSLSKGLPFPILTVAEYLSLDDEGFGWGRIYRKAGYFSAITLWWESLALLLLFLFLFLLSSFSLWPAVCCDGKRRWRKPHNSLPFFSPLQHQQQFLFSCFSTIEVIVGGQSGRLGLRLQLGCSWTFCWWSCLVTVPIWWF